MTLKLLPLGAGVLAVWMPVAGLAQPYSQSMAQCAGLALALSDWTESPQTYDLTLHAAAVWQTAAQDQAMAEGVSAPAAYVSDQADQTRHEWLAKGKGAVFSADFRDWTSYCRKFGRHMGLDFS